MAERNSYLPEFIREFNARFGEAPRSDVNAYRPLTTKEDPARILAWQETRSLSKNLTMQFEKVLYQIQADRPTYADFCRSLYRLAVECSKATVTKHNMPHLLNEACSPNG